MSTNPLDSLVAIFNSPLVQAGANVSQFISLSENITQTLKLTMLERFDHDEVLLAKIIEQNELIIKQNEELLAQNEKILKHDGVI